MANDSCESTPTPSEPIKPGTRMVHCVKFGKEMPGLDRIPWKGEIGKRVYENVSKDAWKLWLEYSKMVMNEYRLNPLDRTSENHGRADGTVLLWRGREIARGLRTTQGKRLRGVSSFKFSVFTRQTSQSTMCFAGRHSKKLLPAVGDGRQSAEVRPPNTQFRVEGPSARGAVWVRGCSTGRRGVSVNFSWA